MEILLIFLALIIGFVFFFAVAIVPVVIKSIKESKEYQELKDKTRKD